ncbi:hypothetical protein DRH13_03610 [Candidatus Woesebacteria bacterium]|nr:MAG: hypothetical protein DRH13_03610 [Candidatus Woesebacteria bacterium]
MNRWKIIFCLSLIAVNFIGIPFAFSQTEQTDIEELKKEAPKIFLDCGMCDIDYIRTEITFVNYVRDRKEAQVHVLITTLRTGSGGREYTISFIGQLDFEGLDDTQKYFSEKTDTQDEIREGLTNAIKIGLASYAAKTPIASRIRVSYSEKAEQKAIEDKWNSWIFSVGGNTRFRGQKSYKSTSLSGSFSASRITEDFKISMSVSASHSKNDFIYEDETIESIQKSMNFNGLFVKSIGDHWSVGAFIRADSSTYENIKYSINAAPAIEFNLYPYSESTRRQFRFLYRFGFKSNNYREETIYDKTSDNLWNQSLSATFDIKEKWGSISTTLSGSNYFHDFSKNRFNIFSILNIRIIKGLSFFAIGSGAQVRDQLSLVKGEASLEDVLLKLTQLETSYSYFFIVGMSFTFGSIFTNVVNPRFGSSGSGGISIIIN